MRVLGEPEQRASMQRFLMNFVHRIQQGSDTAEPTFVSGPADPTVDPAYDPLPGPEPGPEPDP